MTGDLDGIVTFLDKATNPEIHHFRAGTHPGLGWWLKTVCPKPNDPRVDAQSYGRDWQIASYRHPSLICLVATAYDWAGEVIPDTWSVWVADDHDVAMTPQAGGLDLRPIPKHEGDLAAAETLLALAAGLDDPEEAETVREAAEALKADAQKRVPDRHRRQFHVIRGDDP